MTGQISDTFIFHGEEHSLIGIKGGELFSPGSYGMKPSMLHTACYRGFYATYELTEEGLYLRELTIRERNGRYPPIGGVDPVIEDGQATYHCLNVMVPFTGKVRFARDFIEDLYIHMGFQKPTAYKTVWDITLKKGRVVELVDRSQEMEQKRGAFKKRFESGDISGEIEDAFSLDMDLE